MNKFAHLIKVEVDANSNKEYIMRQIDASTFVAEFGRVGTNPQRQEYPLSKWHSKLNEKLKKGYKDISDLKMVTTSSGPLLPGIPTIDALLTKLMKESQQAFEQTYRVSASAITQKQVGEVQNLIRQINAQSQTISSPETLHPKIVELWHILPRNIGKNVKAALPQTMDALKLMMANEQDNIDNANVQQAFTSTNNESLLDKLGIQLSEPLNDLPSELEALIGNYRNGVNIFRLTKPSLDERFNNYVKNATNKETTLRFHGTKWKNGMAILDTGLKILSANYNRLFGDGLYTSREFLKSQHYSDGLLFVLNVHVGETYTVKDRLGVKSYNYYELKAKGYDSVNAEAGLDIRFKKLHLHEQVIYNESQQTFAYLLEAV